MGQGSQQEENTALDGVCSERSGELPDQIDLSLVWRKASASVSNGNCVEVAPVRGGGVAVRDSKNPEGPMLRFTAAVWPALAEGVAAGELRFGPPGVTAAGAGP